MDIKSEKFQGVLEMFVAILLGITAVLTAYASWQSSLYGGNQATNYTKGTAAIGEANSMYNEAAQYIAQDMETWNEISGLRIDLAFAESKGDAAEQERLQYKLSQLMEDNVSDTFSTAIDWADAQTDYASPFAKEGFLESYYTEANAKYDEGDKMIEEGQKANNLGDKLGLVTVIFAVVLFMMGILGTLKNVKTKIVITGVSIAALIFGVVMMLSVPMLTL
jgi:hypothetical protein